jgi:ribonuclease Z
LVFIAFLGTAGAGGIPGRAKSSILLDTGEERLLLDCGPGCAERLAELGYSPCSIDFIFVSHIHLDHWAGLFDLATRYSAEGCTKPPRVLAGPLVVEDVRWIVSRMPGRFREDVRVAAIPEEGWLGLEHARVRVFPTSHTVPCYGAVVEAAGVKVVYTADTRPASTLEGLAGEADVFIVEASMPGGMEQTAEATGHHTVPQASRYRGRLKPGGILVLTHLTRESLAYIASHGVPRGVIVASDLLVLSV